MYQHNAALDFIAETFTSGFLVHIGQTIVIFSTETVLHAVETSQVGEDASADAMM